jgi:uncharacterized protein (TIGR02466 family)
MPTEYWFPTPIYKNIIDNTDAVQTELYQIYDELSFKKVDMWDVRTASFTKHISKNILETYKPKLFLNEIFNNIRCYLTDINAINVIDNNDLIIEESWFAKMESNDFHWQHAHAHYDISGVYYLKTNENDNAIRFHSPTKQHDMSRTMYGLVRNLLITPEPGMLLLFPSWLEHSVPTNWSDEERVSLAFNISMRNRI